MTDMKRILLRSITALALITPAYAQAPGWIPTGEWQCGPHVRVVVSIDGFGAMDFFVQGAWFDNHYTVRRGQLFYNAIPCVSVGNVWPPQPPRKRQTTAPDCDELSKDRDKYRASTCDND
jgi:hypothetical protein